MATCCSISLPSSPWLLLLAVLIGDAAAAMAVPTRPLLRIAEPPTAPGTAAGPAGASSRPGGGRGRPPDRSVAGAEVILAGFAAAVMVIVFCYIRVTRRNSGGGGGGVGVGGKQQRLACEDP